MSRTFAVAAVLAVLVLGGCGKEQVSNAFGDITITSFSAASSDCPTCTAVAGPLPTTPAQFRITGTGFATAAGNGQPVTVRFYQSTSDLVFTPPGPGDAPIFGGEIYADVNGTVCSDTVICGVTPEVDICPPGPGPLGQVFAFVEVILTSGTRDDSTGGSFGPIFSVPFQPPVITGLSDNCYDSLLPEVFTIDVTGINPAGLLPGDVVAMIRFQSTDQTNLDTQTTPGDPVTDTIFNDGTTTNADEPATFVSAGPGPFDVTLRTQSPRATNEVNLTVVIPDIHRTSNPLQSADITVILDNGSCSVPAAPGVNTVTFDRPEGDTAVNNDPLDLDFGTAFVPQMSRRELLITGSNDAAPCEDPFGPSGAKVSVSFATPVGGPTNAFALTGTCTGTADFEVVEGEIINETTIRVVTPRVNALVAGVPTDFTPVIRVHFEDGTISPVTTSFTWIASNVTALSNSCFGSLTSSTFTISGPALGNLNDEVTVRFFSTDATVVGITDPIFADGTATSVDVVGTVTTASAGVGLDVITLDSPLSTNYPSTADPLRAVANAIQNGTFDLYLADGSCLLLNDPDTAVTFNRPEGDTATAGATAAGPFDALVPQTIRQHFVITGSADAGCAADDFAPVGATVLVSFATPVGGPVNAFQLDANGDGTADFDVVEAEITSPTTIEGMTPRVRATVDFVPVIRIHFEDGTIAPVTTPFTWVAPPIITSILNQDAGTGNGFNIGIPGTDFVGCESTTMEINGTGFDAVTPATVIIYDLNSGVTPDELDPELPGTPVRRIGSGNPVDDDLGPVQTTSAVQITGETRMDGHLTELDTDGDGLVTFRVRVQNADLQFGEFDVVWRLAGTAVFIGANGNTQNNVVVGIDPTSLLGPLVAPPVDPGDTTNFPVDDYGTAGFTDTVNGSNITIVSENDPTNAATYEATTVGLFYSRDGGQNWVTRAPIGTAEDGFDATAFRNFAMAEYDLNGNLWVSYLVDDFAVTTQSHLVVLRSSDQGATFDAIGVDGSQVVFSTLAGNVGTLGEPGLSVGRHPTLAGGATVNLVYVDSSAFPDRVFATGLLYGAFGPGGFLGFVGATQVDDGAPVFGFALHARAASGPDGELYVSWVEPDFFGGIGAFIRVDRDRDGQAVGGFAFDTDTIVGALEPLLNVALPSSPDAGPPMPLPVIAVAQTGSHSGRLVIAYEHLVGNLPNPQNSAVVTRYSDDNGFNWSDFVVVHDVDESDQFLPALTSDPVTGRFHVTWQDSSIDAPANLNVTTHRMSASSNDGNIWGDPTQLSANADDATGGGITDYGLQSGVAAFDGCIVPAWADGGAIMAPAAIILQESALPDPSGP